MRRTKQARAERAQESEREAQDVPLADLPVTVAMLPDLVRVTSKLASVETTTALDAARAALNLFTHAVNERRTRDHIQDRANRRLLAMIQLSLPREYGFHYMAKAALDELEREERLHPLPMDGALPGIDAQLRHLVDELTRR